MILMSDSDTDYLSADEESVNIDEQLDIIPVEIASEVGEVIAHNEPVEFQRGLPDQHTYLGHEFNSIPGRVIFADDEIVELCIPDQSGMETVAPPLPGQTVPLGFFTWRARNTAAKIIQGNHTFGVLPREGSKYKVGTTVEILGWHEEPVDRSHINYLGIKAIGKARQRFEVLKTYSRREGDNVYQFAEVKILPEVSLSSVANSYISGHNLRLSKLSQLKSLSSVPSFIFDLYDPNILMEKIKLHVKTLDGTAILAVMPNSEILDICYWLILQLPFSEEFTMELLSMNCVVQRLRAILSVIGKFEQGVCCKECNSSLAVTSDSLALSLHGPHGTFVNPGGYIHDTLTYSNASGIDVITSPTMEFSWFPGYNWQIMICHSCGEHLGWKFTNKDLNPDNFFCFTKSSVSLRITKKEDSPENFWVM
ncbi:protein cereblon-like isoform X2 [Artemia franciscana]|uniref:protein cereblon-like isoform X2 n=1 Tax=Artemia franciscana TaxID=6661 RepID=UPI0032DA51E9